MSREEILRALNMPMEENNPDLLWFDVSALEEGGGIDELREIQPWLSLSPVRRSRRLWVIEHADLLSISAQNTLLKTLEEPPAASSIVLITNREYKLLPTVRSRTVRMAVESSGHLDMAPPALPDLLLQVLESTPGKALEAVDVWDKAHKEEKRDAALAVMQEGLRALRARSLTQPTSAHLRQLKFSAACIDALQRNANVRLTLDWWALRLAKPRTIR